MQAMAIVERSLLSWMTYRVWEKSLPAAVDRAYEALIERHPEWEACLFDEHFVHHHVLPMLHEAVEQGASLLPTAVAAAWAAQVSSDPKRQPHLTSVVMPIATEFVHLVRYAL